MRKINETNTISEILNGFAFSEISKTKSMDYLIKQSTIFSFWEEIVGFKFAKISKPFSIKNKKLMVSAKSPIVIQEMTMLKTKILTKLNSFSKPLGFEIKDIIFDYKNYNNYEIEKENSIEDIPIWYNDEILENIQINEDRKNILKEKITRINFLSETQKEKLLSKLINVEKAKIKRLGVDKTLNT